MSPKVVFGDGALDALTGLEGRRALVVTDGVIRKLGLLAKVIERLEEANMDVKTFDEVVPEPSLRTIQSGLAIASEFRPDLIIGLGGGSCMDAAKAIWAIYERPDLTIEDINPFIPLGLRKKAKLVAIPSTSGTGSETTGFCVISLEGRKIAFGSGELIPDVAIVDPELTVSLSAEITASTGLDALSHAIEAYACTWNNDFTDGIAMKAIQLIFEYLPKAFRDGGNANFREKMHNAASMAGIAISNSETMLAHSMGHQVGAAFNVPHGVAVGVMLPYTIQYNARKAPERYAMIAKGLDIRYETVSEGAERLVRSLKDLMNGLDLPVTLRDLGLSKGEVASKIDLMVRQAAKDDASIANPRVAPRDDLKTIYWYAFEGKDIDF